MGLDADPEQPILFLMIDFSLLIDGVAGLALRIGCIENVGKRHGLAFGLYFICTCTSTSDLLSAGRYLIRTNVGYM